MVIPIADVNPVRRRAVVTPLLLLLNVLIFFTEPVSGVTRGATTDLGRSCEDQAYFREYAAIPRELTRNAPLEEPVPTGDVGRDPATGEPGCVVGPPLREKIPALSVLSAMFLHGGWAHLLGNMLFLAVFGNNIEDRFGRLRYLLFYLGCGYLATYAYALFYADTTTPLVGASGAIAGVLGAYFLLFPRARIVALVPFLLFLPLRIPAWLVLGSWFLVQYVYFTGAGMASSVGVAYLAHVAGFVAGVAGAMLLRRRNRPARFAGY